MRQFPCYFLANSAFGSLIFDDRSATVTFPANSTACGSGSLGRPNRFDATSKTPRRTNS